VRLTFHLRFHTHPGQSVLLAGNHALLGNDDVRSAIPLEYASEQFWRTTIELPSGEESNTEITYRYIWRFEDGSLREDWGNGRGVNPAMFKTEELLVIDSWNYAGFYENAFYTEPFRKVLLSQWQSEVRTAEPSVFTHLFRVRAPLLRKGQTLCLLGNAPALGNWGTQQPILLNRLAGNDWLSVKLDLTGQVLPIEYKYGVYDATRSQFVRYEDGNNRLLNGSISARKITVLNDGFAVLPSTTWKGAGVAIPVFSLRSKASFGVGEFTDLKLLADWCQQAGLKLIQVLPVNDTTATHTSADSYPHAAISAFALHPLYLNLGQVASKANQPLVRAAEEERKRLNDLKDLDYQSVMSRKMALAKELFLLQKDGTFKSEGYKRFFEDNKLWLVPYAVFCYFRDKYGTPDFNRWESHRSCLPQELNALLDSGSPAREQLEFSFFIQYHLHLQLLEATEYAHSKGVILKGDIPIGVSRFGSDAWLEPQLYQMNMQAGAPPDAFGIKGQNWSFPTYDWQRMMSTGFAWWKHRFEQMGHYFDAFRIDHILGFFRIWSIPTHEVEGIMGYFVPAIPVPVDEFIRRGIRFDRNRYARPFITDAVLQDIFGSVGIEDIKNRFLDRTGTGECALRPEFATQRQVEHYFAQLESSVQNDKLREGLFDLVSNVILFEEARQPDREFHFRFSIETTSSFKHLDPRTQSQLRELYIDYFFHRQDALWMKEGLQKLPALKRVTNMLVCGEDLGMVPACVPETMKQLGLLSLEVQRMPKRLNQEFSQPKDAPYLSVVTPSTHDMSTIRGWWTEDRTVTQRFYNHVLESPGAAPAECEPWICRRIVQQHLASPAMWSIFQLQDLLGMYSGLRRANPAEERINVPADAKNYWRYRMHLWLEDLVGATGFNSALKQDLERGGR
jgi:4-alpha-glucanotransferase